MAVALAFALVPAVPLPSPAAAASFTDIGTSPFRSDIVWLADQGITSGCTKDRFCPKDEVTRAQMASFVVRAFRLAAASRDYFGDDNGSIHEGAINALAVAGITSGCSAGKFCPGDEVTRGQMASFLSRALRLTGEVPDFFVDDWNSVHEPTINLLAAERVTGGCAPAKFCPSATVTREQMAAFLHRALVPASRPSGVQACTVTFTGDASGGSDVTGALESFLRSAPAGANACLAAGGQYKVNGTINLPNRENGLTIDGRGARLFATVRRNSAMLRFSSGGRDIVVRDLTIEGHNPNGRTSNAHEYAWEFGMGISLYGVVNATITNVRILNVNGDGIYISGGHAGSAFRWAQGINVHKVLIDGTGRHGVALTNGIRGTVIQGSTVRNTGMYPFVIEPDGEVHNGVVVGAEDVTITGNAIDRYTIDSSWGPYLFAASGHAPQHDLEFSNNVVYGQNLHVAVQPNGYARTHIRILNNRSTVRVPGPVMEFAGCNYLTVSGNVQLLSSGPLASVSGCTNVSFSNNTTN